MSKETVRFDKKKCPGLGRVRQICGAPEGRGVRLAVVSSRFNEHLTRQLVQSAVREARKRGVVERDLLTVWVPGAYEIPVAVNRLAGSGRFDAVLAMGCVVEGETPHAQLITESVTQALTRIALRHGLPVIDCVVATRTMEQAEARCRPGPRGRGGYAACAALDMVSVLRQLPEAGS